MFDPKLRRLGLQTNRALLQDSSTCAAEPRGRHLAVHIERIEGRFTDAEYLARLPDVLQVFLPTVLKRWGELETLDICLEPRAAVDARAVPAPYVQFGLSRRDGRRVRWSNLNSRP